MKSRFKSLAIYCQADNTPLTVNLLFTGLSVTFLASAPTEGGEDRQRRPYRNSLHYLVQMRQQGQYGDPSSNAYVAAQMHHMADQRMETKPNNFEEQLEAFTPERENQYANSKPEVQRRWEVDGSNALNSVASCQGGDASRSFFQDQRLDHKMALQNQSKNPRSVVHKEDTDVIYEANNLSHTYEGLEQKFLDDILKLSKEQSDAEDVENARHREKLNAINAQYEEKLAALRAQHASRRNEFLQRESKARQHQYQQTIRDPHPSGGMPPGDPRGYSSAIASTAIGEMQMQRGYTADPFDRYGERNRFLGGGARVQEFEPRGSYPGGRVYDTGSRHYS
ncbi:uncharacterized protein LOC129312749 isoform X1 [Prosopis cineraria]|uniref:uncharacterized protein LOC129312749 isoform X1 n=2 Tax=Prosopis cineraria TaxID=364024 RepID=UPI00240EE8CD|nr:uncharacterized protein LOC129312749 isoform X1 [Prosopis cineraria]XP_054811416.1 uncharacterized protein LOC129312749 isoform X1 [Prosopis cineraria]